MKLFHIQFQECENNGNVGISEPREMAIGDLPPIWHPASKKIADKYIKNGIVPVLTESTCLLFGGKCSSEHKECQKMRLRDEN